MGYLDAMKQEYATARWTFYEALASDDTHVSDAGLTPHDTGDEPVYGLRIERLKTTKPRSVEALPPSYAWYRNEFTAPPAVGRGEKQHDPEGPPR